MKIVPCPIVREPDGLAMSSRNLLLGVEERINAPIIYQTLNKTKELKASMSVAELKKWVIQQINKNPYLKVDYFEIVDDFYLKPVINWNDKNNKIGCIAVKAGNIRLIDNIRL
jgi:pantoate--beta-alanine ligase